MHTTIVPSQGPLFAAVRYMVAAMLLTAYGGQV